MSELVPMWINGLKGRQIGVHRELVSSLTLEVTREASSLHIPTRLDPFSDSIEACGEATYTASDL